MSKNGVSELHFACALGLKDKALLLIEQGADIAAIFNDGTPLHLACQNSHMDTAVILIDRGAKIEGFNPLHMACLEGNIDITLMLIEHGANPIDSVSGFAEGSDVGLVGTSVGRAVGLPVGSPVGIEVGEEVGWELGAGEGKAEGRTVGSDEDGILPIDLAIRRGHFDLAATLEKSSYALVKSVSTLQLVAVVDVFAPFIAVRSVRLQTGVGTTRVVLRRHSDVLCLYVMVFI